MKLSNDSAGELALLLDPELIRGVSSKESLLLSEPALLQRLIEGLH
jgi:hypothetical protein